jgi:hypothetical protein
MPVAMKELAAVAMPARVVAVPAVMAMPARVVPVVLVAVPVEAPVVAMQACVVAVPAVATMVPAPVGAPVVMPPVLAMPAVMRMGARRRGFCGGRRAEQERSRDEQHEQADHPLVIGSRGAQP